MALLNFHRRFVPRVKDGSKTHTIRGKRKRPIKAGEMLHLYTGLRRKGAELIMRVPCVKVEDIQIQSAYDGFVNYMSIDGQELSTDEKEALAKRDGFDSLQEMLRFWDGRLPFNGDIIHWRSPNGEN